MILKINNKKRYKVQIEKGTPGDSFGYHASNKYLRKKFANYRFVKLQKGLKKYFQWIDKLPKNKKLYNYHPLKLAQKQDLKIRRGELSI